MAKNKFALGNKYLVAYNAAQAMGWYYVIISMAIRFVIHGTKSFSTTYDSLGSIVCTLQAFSFLEILHVYFGLVPSSLLPTIMQVFGRNMLLLVCLNNVYRAQSHWGVVLLFSSWGISELIRYPYYIAALRKEIPSYLTWLRYNAFIVLYPPGFAAENILYYQMLDFIKTYKLFSISLPNSLNFSFSFYYFILCWITISMFGFVQVYLYMLAQRKRKLSPVANKSN